MFRLGALSLLAATLGACAEKSHPTIYVSEKLTSCAVAPCSWGNAPLVQGGTVPLHLTLDTMDDVTFEDMDLVSTARDVVEIIGFERQGTEADLELAARGAGTTTLAFQAADGYLLYRIPLEVRVADRLVTSADANGDVWRDKIPGLGDQFMVDVGTSLKFYPTPYAGDDYLVGTIRLSVSVDESSVPPDQWLPPIDPQTLARGYFSTTVTPGDHDIRVNAAGVSTRFRVTGDCSNPPC